MKILISAYECNPGIGSESEVGWQWALNLSRYHKIVVLTKRPPSVDKVQGLISENSNICFEYYDLPEVFNFMRTGDIRHALYYNLWQIGAYLHAKKILISNCFDLVHHLVYVNSWQPTYMGFLGLPFVFGPVGENPRIPYSIAHHYGSRLIRKEAFIAIFKYFCRNINPLMQAVYKRATRVIAINRDVYAKINHRFHQKTVIYPAIGSTEPSDTVVQVFEQENKLFRVLYAGRFSYIKCPDIALNAYLKFAEKYSDVELIMIGSGPLHKKIENIIAHSQVGFKVTLLPWQERSAMHEYMKTCDIFLFPSCEGGGMVFLEAISHGKPVVCLDFGGAKDFITDECGIKVKVKKVNEIENALAHALEKLYSSQSLRKSMALAGRKRFLELYDWKQKALWMSNLYKSMMEQ
jgi:glycosyltransferase involved in cell wall biosynthesis